MLVSYILRVRPHWLRGSKFSAELEAVATGQRAVVRSIEEAREFVVASMFQELEATRRAQEAEKRP